VLSTLDVTVALVFNDGILARRQDFISWIPPAHSLSCNEGLAGPRRAASLVEFGHLLTRTTRIASFGVSALTVNADQRPRRSSGLDVGLADALIGVLRGHRAHPGPTCSARSSTAWHGFLPSPPTDSPTPHPVTHRSASVGVLRARSTTGVPLFRRLPRLPCSARSRRRLGGVWRNSRASAGPGRVALPQPTDTSLMVWPPSHSSAKALLKFQRGQWSLPSIISRLPIVPDDARGETRMAGWSLALVMPPDQCVYGEVSPSYVNSEGADLRRLLYLRSGRAVAIAGATAGLLFVPATRQRQRNAQKTVGQVRIGAI